MAASLPPVATRSLLAAAARGGLPALPLPILSLDLTAPDFMVRYVAMGGTYSRAGTKRYIGADGLLKVAAANEWPAEYDVYTRRPIGRSVYPTVSPNNLAGRDFTNAAWTKTTMTAALDQTGIDGATNSASSLLATAANAVVAQAITDASSVKRGLSLFMKRLVGTGTIEISANGGSTWKAVTAEVFADGWNRVWKIEGATYTNPDIRIRLGTSGDKIAVDCCMITQIDHIGAPTFSGETTNADTNSLPVTGCPVAGCLVARFHGLSTGVGTRYVAALCASASEVRAGIVLSSNTLAKINAVAIDGTTQVDYEAGTTAAPGYPVLDTSKLWWPHRVAVQWKANDYRSAVDGFPGAGDTAATLGDVTRLSIGVRYTDYSTSLDGAVARIDVYPELGDDQLLLVTATPDAVAIWSDSLGSTTGATATETAWPYLMRVWLGAGASGVGLPKPVISKAVGGQTSAQVRARFEAEPLYRPFTTIIVAGQNDSPGADVAAAAVAAAAAIANIAAMVAALGHDRFLVLTVPALVADGAVGSIARTYKLALNSAIKAAWPANHVDFEGFLLAYGGDGGGTDNTAITAGQMPPLTTGDGTHPNDKGHKLRAMAVMAVLERKGWINAFAGSLAA